MSNDKAQPQTQQQPQQPAPAQQNNQLPSQPVTMPRAGDGTPFQKSNGGKGS